MKRVDEAHRRSCRNEVRECALIALLLYSVVPGVASAGDSPPGSDTRRNAQAAPMARAHVIATSIPAPFAFVAPRAEMQASAPTEFRARKPGLLETAAATDQAFTFDAPMLRDTSIARGLTEAKSQNRVRLLTLWQTGASSLSLQAGKRGAPSLQWSTPWMQRGAASRGLFDRWIAVSPRGFGGTSRGGAAHQAGAIAPAKGLESGAAVDDK